MDQFASAFGETGKALLLDCRTLEHRTVALPLDDLALVVCHSGSPRRLETSAYNERRSQCEAAVAVIARDEPGVTALRDVTPADARCLPRAARSDRARPCGSHRPRERARARRGRGLRGRRSRRGRPAVLREPRVDARPVRHQQPGARCARRDRGGRRRRHRGAADRCRVWRLHGQPRPARRRGRPCARPSCATTRHARASCRGCSRWSRVEARRWSMAELPALFGDPHRRYDPLRDEWVLVSPGRTNRPWQGGQERPQVEQRPAFDPACYLCPGNTRANGETNPPTSPRTSSPTTSRRCARRPATRCSRRACCGPRASREPAASSASRRATTSRSPAWRPRTSAASWTCGPRRPRSSARATAGCRCSRTGARRWARPTRTRTARSGPARRCRPRRPARTRPSARTGRGRAARCCSTSRRRRPTGRASWSRTTTGW